ncbi:uncharacterized protein GGS25DRAFT_523660 [Hypoxylon fragiforme]|uniref:uncharacterized protein n=1 Tax=Hypoxylon fragiforme TaxID=63214 RepID=UPI0020C60428|nr:uncharacterized protein GGS25DRAFT_523660 [Hypoxylon fragiforme]KAI2605990.1 hypothetical protein GGS25DRAFT_523660 [Hypoxylon fragiforme]
MANSILALLPLAISLASASAALPRAAPCWTGGIHSACNGAATGCTPDGILVKCQESTGAMIWASMCEEPGQDQRTCSYDADCNASCAA